MSPAGFSWLADRTGDLACARTLIGDLVRVRDLAYEFADQVQIGDHRRAGASASSLASRFGDLTRFCREHAAALGRLQDLTIEIGLVQEMRDMIGSVQADPFTISVNSAVDYDLFMVQIAAEQLSRTLDSAHVHRHSVNGLQIQVGPSAPASLQQAKEAGAEQQEQAPSTPIAPSAGRLLAIVSRLLPPSDRARYAKEYESELWELASAGAGQVGQLRYATRQALRVGQVRGEVLAPRSKSAAP